ncbi:DNA-binding response regulator [Paenibacillus selenitireducens]|jgi:DNA-binding response OmpR family regulator|uniref:DNA-binding response regulator n=1 Tax=Paenibacillus selenitireducens TaxID=1324314 RepID=A0A1T2XGQ3_9BACL|nr:response regulator transcription factor [Paenibacillus selenitireducens]OPA79030.1 DNA-binding response regulator [Paenibacillus selenitireducens]
MKHGTILLVDDEADIIKLMQVFLQNEGYRLLTASNGKQALEWVEKESVDLIILDIMMPVMDGLQVCMKIREEHQMPIIFLSAKGQEIDKITGLSLGADDYVTKPFSPLELIARVKSQLRRYNNYASNGSSNEEQMVIDDLVINISTHEVTVDGNVVKLTPREFAILELLARNQGLVLSMEQIYENVWKDTYMDSNNTVMVHIRKIREKIEPNPRAPKFIKTIWGVGYKIDKIEGIRK